MIMFAMTFRILSQKKSEQDLLKAQRKDEAYQTLLKLINNETNTKGHPSLLLNTKILRNAAYILWKIKRRNLEDQYFVPYVLDSLMPKAFTLTHSDTTAGHNGPEITLKRFRENFYNNQEVN